MGKGGLTYEQNPFNKKDPRARNTIAQNSNASVIPSVKIIITLGTSECARKNCTILAKATKKGLRNF